MSTPPCARLRPVPARQCVCNGMVWYGMVWLDLSLSPLPLSLSPSPLSLPSPTPRISLRWCALKWWPAVSYVTVLSLYCVCVCAWHNTVKLSSLSRASTTSARTCKIRPAKARTRMPAARTCAKSESQRFADHALAEVQDIEQLVIMGTRLKACPYYGARKAIDLAQVITMPYNLQL